MQVGPNDPCPCGSGRKYKRCCAPQARQAARAPQIPPPELAALLACYHAQRFAAMEEGARALLAREPRLGVAWKMLGIALARQGKDSLPASEQAAALLPDDADAHNNLGLALLGAGQFARAAEAFRQALRILPGFADAALNLGSALQAQGEFAAAADSARRAIELRPGFVDAHNNLGNALRSLGQAAAAMGAFRRALELDPDNALAHNNLGNVLRELERPAEAIASYERAIALRPGLVAAHCNLGILARLQGDAPRARLACRTALELDPAHLPAILLGAALSADQGDFTAALAACEQALALDPRSPEALAAIPAYRRMTPADEAWAARAGELLGRGLGAPREALLQFALGKYQDDVGAYAQAFASYRRANDLTRSLRPHYDPAAMEAFVERLMRVSLQPPPREPATAVLIVGMPRSGTSLAEQILASHPRLQGAGELPFWRDWWAGRASAAPDPQSDELARAGEDYLAQLAAQAGTLGIGIDKMPYNFLYLGLIGAALPGVRIIHLERDPRDTCLSIYFQDFAADQPYAADEQWIVHYYRQYLRIMAHWRRVLPLGSLHEVHYEALVGDPEGSSRRMLEFLGLTWDPRCLEFQRTARSVRTASQWQVRQKIHSGSVGRWRHYEPYLGAIRELGAE